LTTEETLSDCRRRLIEAAAEAFREEGYRASMERIAAKAGANKRMLYYHVGKKDTAYLFKNNGKVEVKKAPPGGTPAKGR